MEIPRQTDQPFHNDTIGPKKVLTKKDPENRLDKEKPLLTNHAKIR